MKEKFFALYHNVTKKFTTQLPPANEWPVEWNTLEYKTYERLPKKKLPPVNLEHAIFDLLHSRRSAAVFSGEGLGLEQWGMLLGSGVGKSSEDFGGWRRVYPSAGGMYPLEVYVVVLISTEDLSEGVYHYDVKEHQLSRLFVGSVLSKLSCVYSEEQISKAAGLILFTAVFDRTIQKYGERGYRFCLQESGHAGQNILLISSAIGLKSLPVTPVGDGDEVLEKILGIDGFAESLLYGILVGR